MTGHHHLPEGYEHYLIKFDGVDANNDACDPQGYSNIEYAYFLMAREAGIDIMDCYLLEEGKRQHFITKRFDRQNNQKIHVQTLCALTGIDFNVFQSGHYRDYFSAIVNLNLSIREKEEAFRRMVFNVLSYNCDDHTKNFSFLMDSNGRWSLAPAYDLTHAYNERNPNAWTKEHNLLINGGITKGLFISLEDMMIESQILELPQKNRVEIVQQVVQSVSQWAEFAEMANVSKAKKSTIKSRIFQAINDLNLKDMTALMKIISLQLPK